MEGGYTTRSGRSTGKSRGVGRGKNSTKTEASKSSRSSKRNKVHESKEEIEPAKPPAESTKPAAQPIVEEFKKTEYDQDCDISSLEAPTFTTLDRGPPAPMLSLTWDHPVQLIGEKVMSPRIHICDNCQKPILIYGRMIPCKHVFCLYCAQSELNGVCSHCDELMDRVEQAGLGTVFMCTFSNGDVPCKRTYLSQRDLQAHIDHRHLKQSTITSRREEPPSSERFNARDPRGDPRCHSTDPRAPTTTSSSAAAPANHIPVMTSARSNNLITVPIDGTLEHHSQQPPLPHSQHQVPQQAPPPHHPPPVSMSLPPPTPQSFHLNTMPPHSLHATSQHQPPAPRPSIITPSFNSPPPNFLSNFSSVPGVSHNQPPPPLFPPTSVPSTAASGFPLIGFTSHDAASTCQPMTFPPLTNAPPHFSASAMPHPPPHMRPPTQPHMTSHSQPHSLSYSQSHINSHSQPHMSNSHLHVAMHSQPQGLSHTQPQMTSHSLPHQGSHITAPPPPMAPHPPLQSTFRAGLYDWPHNHPPHTSHLQHSSHPPPPHSSRPPPQSNHPPSIPQHSNHQQPPPPQPPTSEYF